MKLSIAITSLVAVSLGVVQGRVLLNGNIEVMGGREGEQHLATEFYL
jgi:hypothetical protein